MVWHYEDPESAGGAPRVAVDRGRLINVSIKGTKLELLTVTQQNAADLARPSSAHAAGANFSFADGGSRFISETIIGFTKRC